MLLSHVEGETESDCENYLSPIHLRRALCQGCDFPDSFPIVLAVIQKRKNHRQALSLKRAVAVQQCCDDLLPTDM